MATIIALTVHAIALGLAPTTHQAGGRAGAAAPAMTIRWIEGKPTVDAMPSPEAPPPRKAGSLAPEVYRAEHSAPAVPAAPTRATPPAESAQISAALSIQRDGLLLDYLPRAMLTVAPAPQSSIEIAFPEGVVGEVHLSAELSLFIDETGVVQQVRIDSVALPPPMEQVARDAFMRAHFSPGEVDGHAVRSVIRVEVTFDADTQPIPVTAR